MKIPKIPSTSGGSKGRRVHEVSASFVTALHCEIVFRRLLRAHFRRQKPAHARKDFSFYGHSANTDQPLTISLAAERRTRCHRTNCNLIW